MIIAGIYSFNKGQEVIDSQHPNLFREIREIISRIDSESCKTKISKEKTMTGKLLYHPPSLNLCFKHEFEQKGWQKQRVLCDYQTQYLLLIISK